MHQVAWQESLPRSAGPELTDGRHPSGALDRGADLECVCGSMQHGGMALPVRALCVHHHPRRARAVLTHLHVGHGHFVGPLNGVDVGQQP